jgi:putative transposase
MRRAFKYRLYPNANQERELNTLLETHRRLYNQCLELRKAAWKLDQTTLSAAAQSRWYTQERKTNPWYGRMSFSSAREAINRLDKAFQAFFRRVKSGEKPGYPRFKGRDRFDSFTYQYNNGVKFVPDRLRCQYVGDVKVKLHRPFLGTIKTVTVKREADKWFAVFSCDLGALAIAPSLNPPVGIDVGLESFLTTSDGHKEPNPRYLKTTLAELRRCGRAVARKKRGGKNRRKAVRRLRVCHVRVKNLRKEHHHQTSLKLVRRFGLIAVERLNIRGMLKNDRLSRAIADAGWYGFVQTLRCKAEGAGVAVVDVDPRGTSQLCSGCGTEVPKGLSVRWHDCPHCGLSLDRDENAARNILARALPARIGPADGKPGVALVRPRSSPPLDSSGIMDPSPGTAAGTAEQGGA